MAMAWCSTRWQVVAPKLTAMELRMPALVKNQGSQTGLGTCDNSSPKAGLLGTPTRAGLLGTPKREMLRRAQPVIREIEARKYVGAERLDLDPRGNVLNLPSGMGLLQPGYINGKCMGADPLMALVGPAARGGQDDDPTGGTRNLLNETKKGGSVQRPSGFQKWAPSRRKWPSSGSSLRRRRWAARFPPCHVLLRSSRSLHLAYFRPRCLSVVLLGANGYGPWHAASWSESSCTASAIALVGTFSLVLTATEFTLWLPAAAGAALLLGAVIGTSWNPWWR